jgi:hypothetical protein
MFKSDKRDWMAVSRALYDDGVLYMISMVCTVCTVAEFSKVGNGT